MFTGYEGDTLTHLGSIPYLRKTAPFLLYAIRRLSQEAQEGKSDNTEGWLNSSLLFERFIAAVPQLTEELEKDEREFIMRDAFEIDMQIEFLRNFAERMGLVEIHTGENVYTDIHLRPTPLFSVVFE